MNKKSSYRTCLIGWCLLLLLVLLRLTGRRLGLPVEAVWHILPPCIFRRYTGFYCPGCGGTRAVRALLSGRFLQAVWYHPLVPYTAVILGIYLISNTVEWITGGRLRIGIRWHTWMGIMAVILIAVHWILHNILLYAFSIPL